MDGLPLPFEKRAVTGTGSPDMWAAVVRPDSDGVNVPAIRVPLAWATRAPACSPAMALIESTTSSAKASTRAA